MSESLGTIHVCQGPPRCDLMGDEAVAAMEAGCVWCRRVAVYEDGDDVVTEPATDALTTSRTVSVASAEGDAKTGNSGMKKESPQP